MDGLQDQLAHSSTQLAERQRQLEAQLAQAEAQLKDSRLRFDMLLLDSRYAFGGDASVLRSYLRHNRDQLQVGTAERRTVALPAAGGRDQ